MKWKQTILLLISFVLISCSKDNEPVPDGACYIDLNAPHNRVSDIDEFLHSNTIQPCKILIIKQKGYTYRNILEPTPNKPNAIHLAHYESSYYYRAEWNNSDEFSLSDETLIPLDNSPPFVGFMAGNVYMLAIGHDNYVGEQTIEVNFKPMWISSIEVTK